MIETEKLISAVETDLFEGFGLSDEEHRDIIAALREVETLRAENARLQSALDLRNGRDAYSRLNADLARVTEERDTLSKELAPHQEVWSRNQIELTTLREQLAAAEHSGWQKGWAECARALPQRWRDILVHGRPQGHEHIGAGGGDEEGYEHPDVTIASQRNALEVMTVALTALEAQLAAAQEAANHSKCELDKPWELKMMLQAKRLATLETAAREVKRCRSHGGTPLEFACSLDALERALGENGR